MIRAFPLLVIVIAATSVRGQDPPSPVAPQQDPAVPNAPQEAPPVAVADSPQEAAELLVWNSGTQRIHLEIGTGVLYLLGDVEAEIGTRKIRCDNLIAWLDLSRKKETSPTSENPDPALIPDPLEQQRQQASEYVKEIYAEGHVIYQDEGQWMRADRIYLDLRKERGLVVDATLSVQTRGKDRPIPLTIRAEELRLLSRNRLEGSGVQSFVSPFGQPGSYLTHERIEIIKDRPGVAAGAADDERTVNYHVAAEGNVFHTLGTPVVWLPDFVADSAARPGFLYLQSVRYGRSNEFGQEIGVSVGDEIGDGSGGTWGAWTVDGDWLSKRGPGAGVDLVYEQPSYRGLLRTRYQRDHGKDENYGEPTTKNRGRISWWHRHMLPGEIQLDTELQLFSDRGFYPTYYEDEQKGLKPPENLVYLKKVFFNSMVSGLFSHRFNDWMTRVEHHPELRYDLVREPLFDIGNHPLYLDVSTRASNSKLRYDDDLDLGSDASMRVDVDALLEYAMPLGPFKLTPFAGLRYTYYERDLWDREDRNRVGFTFGGTLSMQAWKVFEADGGVFDLDGLRHVILPQVTFRNTTGVRVHPDELIPFDEVERFDNVQVFELRLRNLLQTVRHREQGPVVDTFLDLEIEQLFFPNAGRDHSGNPWSNLDVDVLLRFSDDLQMVSDFEINWSGGGFEVLNAAFGYTPSRETQVYAGYRHFRDTYDAVFVQGNHRFNEKWMVTLESSYDFFEDRGLDHRFVVSHIGPEWVIQLGLRADVGENDFSVVFSFEPRFLFDPILRPGALRAEPRLLYLGSGLRH